MGSSQVPWNTEQPANRGAAWGKGFRKGFLEEVTCSLGRESQTASALGQDSKFTDLQGQAGNVME